MTDKVKTWWEQYAVQIVGLIVIMVGFYFTTNFRMQSAEDAFKNHETRIQSLEIEQAKTSILLRRIDERVEAIDRKIDKMIESKGTK